jgi:hypothetical protein
MSDNDIDASELAKWDPVFTAQAKRLVAPIINRWFRVEVRGLESIPSRPLVGCCWYPTTPAGR